MTNFVDKQPFIKYKLDEESKSIDTFTVRLNTEERNMLEEAKKILEQERDSTAFKQMAYIGFICVTLPLNKAILETIFTNKRKNRRTGIMQFET